VGWRNLVQVSLIFVTIVSFMLFTVFPLIYVLYFKEFLIHDSRGFMILKKIWPKGRRVLMWAGGYREGVLSRKIAGSTSATKLQEGEIHEYAGFNPSQPVRSRLEDTWGHGNVYTQVCVLDTAKDMWSWPFIFWLRFQQPLCRNELPPIHGTHVRPAACQQSRW